MGLHSGHIAFRNRTVALSAMLIAALSFATANATPIAFTPIVPETVVTLLMHQVSDAPIHSAHGEDNVKEPWLSPAQFDTLLTMLARRGYTVVPLAEALAILRTGSPARASARPAKPLLITFDDGYQSALATATPILRKHHATATMFFEGVVTGTRPGRLTLANLRTMRASGVWTLESHGWAGHSRLVVAADGTKSPYWYANLMWRAHDGRLETLAEYATRVRSDLRRFRATFEPRLGVKLDVFAYPSGEFGQNYPLARDGNPLTRLEAGHSNSSDLEPVFKRALASEGFRAAFAVDVPGAVHAASQGDGPYEYPRLGIGANFDLSVLDKIASQGIELPEITTGDTFADCMALASDGKGLISASTQGPELFWLARDGRVRDEATLDALLADRIGNPSLISAIVASGDDLVVLQQSGWWPGATAYVNRIHFTGDAASVISRTTLPAALHWTVGAFAIHGRIVAMTDRGAFFDLASTTATPLFTVSLPPGDDRNARFAGPARVGDRIFVYDRKLFTIDEIDERGNVIGTSPLRGDIRALASSGADLLAVDWSEKRRIILRFRLANV